MRMWMQRTMLVFGLVVGGGEAMAQAPAQPRVPVQPVPQAPARGPVQPAQAVMAAPVAMPAPVGMPAPVAVVDPAVTQTRGGFLSRATIGEGCANPITCGNWASERTFLFGSCKQFFNPGNKCGGGGCGSHNNPGPCSYSTYLNR